MTGSSPLRILIADDTESDRLILESIVRGEGHAVISARNGNEAVEQFRRRGADLVLMDALMPGMDGFDAARRIKELAGEHLVPVIFLTSLTETEALVKCLDAGGDDFLQKPYNRVILKAKIKAFNRMREMHATMVAQRNQIVQHNNHLIQEQTVAKQVFDKIAHSGCLDAANVRYHLSPRAVFNGDVLVAARRPSGSMLVLLGDFTGHGLPAAIGAMPLASTFYGMAEKGFALTDILLEINQKLKDSLPLGVFCCATFLEINFHDCCLTAWNGGLPEGYIHRRASGLVQPIRSRHLPLGVLPSTQLKTDCEHHRLDPGDRCFLWSDGIHEARNRQGEMFGEERLKAVFRNNQNADRLFEEVMESVHAFIGGGERDDDLSLVEIRVDGPAEAGSAPFFSNGFPEAMEWNLQFEVLPSTFRHFDPMPLLVGLFSEIPGLRSHTGTLYTILGELYSNALEHGILGLDSDMKRTPEGFAGYYRLRSELLQSVQEGFIRFHFAHEAQREGGCLLIRVSDSGDGFSRGEGEGDPARYSGRGIPLLRQLCSSLKYLGNGNQVEAVYQWRAETSPPPTSERSGIAGKA